MLEPQTHNVSSQLSMDFYADRCLALRRTAITRRLTMAACLALQLFLIKANAQSEHLQIQAEIKTTQIEHLVRFDDSKSIGLAHKTPQELEWFLKGIRAVHAARLAIRPFISRDDAKLDNLVYYNISMDGSIDAYAERDDDGDLRITLNTGLIRSIEQLAWAQVMGAEFGDHACYINYLHYISSKPRGLVQPPPIFAISHPRLCAVEGLSVLIHRPDGRDQELLQEYTDLQILGLSFVVLHEFAHIRYNNFGAKSIGLAVKRKNETIADKFAINCMRRMRADPTLALPVLLLIAQVESDRHADRINDHPDAYKRMRIMVRLSKRRINSIHSNGVQPLTIIQKKEMDIVKSYVADFLTEAKK